MVDNMLECTTITFNVHFTDYDFTMSRINKRTTTNTNKQ